MKVAEALVLRKHLAEKVEQLKPIKLNGDQGLFEIKTQRQPVGDGIDQVTLQIPKVELSDVTEEYDRYSKALRILDVRIQEANWVNELDFNEDEYLKKPKKSKEN